MKKIFLRSALIALMLTAAVALLVWYFAMRREVPEHARVIPPDAFAVATINLRELALDHKGKEHLFPEMNNSSLAQKEFSSFFKAVESNGASGVEESADILLFAYHTGDAAFFGAVVELEDSAAFGKLVRVHVSRDYNIQSLTGDGVPVVQLDTTAAIIGWTDDVALLLYPIGNHTVPVVSQQCIKLLKQPAEKSVLTNEAFRAHELKSFSISLWFQSKPFLEFSGGGALAEQLTDGVDYFNYFADFEDGEMLIRSEWQMHGAGGRDRMAEISFPCESKYVLGFVRTHLRTDVDSLRQVYADVPVMSDLPLNDEECMQLLPYLDGNCISITHDTLLLEGKAQYTPDSLNTDQNLTYAKDFILVPSTTSFRIKEPAKAAALLNQIMSRDSIPLTNRGWVYTSGGIEWRLILTDDLLTVTNSPDVDGRNHAIPAELYGYMMWYDLQKLFAQKDPGLIGFLIPDQEAAYPLFAQHLHSFRSTLPVQVGNMRRSEMVLKFVNTKVNALVQAEDLISKVYFPLSR